jgi:hypothetical protein
LPEDRSHRRTWRLVSRFGLRRCQAIAASRDSESLLRRDGLPSDAERTGRYKPKRLPGSPGGQAIAPLWLRGACVARRNEVTGSRQVQHTPNEKAMVGFAHLFRPMYAWANMGHPSSSLRVIL